MKRIALVIVVAMVSGFFGAYLFVVNFSNQPYHQLDDQGFMQSVNIQETKPYGPNNYNQGQQVPVASAEGLNFVEASEQSTNSVVYIKNISERTYATSWMDMFFDGQNGQRSKQTQVSSGSGVVFNSKGYIVTNNHVIADADKIEVIHNRNTYTATLVGTDPNTDLAVLKLDGAALPAIKVGSSKDLNVGEWVIAVGNPFNLNSTVTAGIVSAKGRSINILRTKFPIESFIQTDAAINPGNSGGALVNVKGELVGINTAILSRTGSYAGYGFAVPVDIVKKVVEDLIQYGEVQKAFFGGEVTDLDAEVAERLDIKIDAKNINGVLLAYLQSDGSAAKAKMKEGDIVLEVEGTEVESKAMFDEIISYHSPGDKVAIKYKRSNKVYETELTLTNREGTTGVLKREIYTSSELGADFEALSKVEKDRLGIESGVRVFNIRRGLINNLGIREDNIIINLNGNDVKNPKKFAESLSAAKGSVTLGWLNSRGRYENYSFYLR